MTPEEPIKFRSKNNKVEEVEEKYEEQVTVQKHKPSKAKEVPTQVKVAPVEEPKPKEKKKEVKKPQPPVSTEDKGAAPAKKAEKASKPAKVKAP